MSALYAPAYYARFSCIADRCRHSCCIGWEIDVDGDAMVKYAALPGEVGRHILESIDTAGTPHFRLCCGDRCPHLTDRGLCRIITDLGEDFLCDICREHPRFYNDVPEGREVGIGMSCEEACRLILSADDYGDIRRIGGTEEDCTPSEFDPRTYRGRIYDVLADTALSYPEKILRIYADFGVSPSILSDAQWQEVLASLEYLVDAHRPLFSAYTSDLKTPAGWEKPMERALAYFIYRHCTEARDPEGFRASLGLCLFFERLLASMAGKAENAEEAARILSEEMEYCEENTDAILWEFALGGTE